MRITCGKCGDVLKPIHRNVIVCCECGAYAIDGESDIIKVSSGRVDDYKKVIEILEELNNEKTKIAKV